MSFRRGVDERHAEGIVAPARLDARDVRRYEGTSDTRMRSFTQQVVRIPKFEGEAQDGRNRRQGYIPLSPVEPDEEIAILTTEDDAIRLDSPRIRSTVL